MSSKQPIRTPSQTGIDRISVVPALRDRNVRKLRARSHEAVTELAAAIIRDNDGNDPFYIFDLAAVVEQWNTWHRLFPRGKPFYAVKCNPEPAMLAALAALGSGFYCSSPAEIESVLAAGATRHRIIYANPSKDESQLRYAAQAGVNLATFHSAGEVQMIKKVHPRCSLLLGTKVPGVLPQEIVPPLEEAKRAGIAVIGVLVHVPIPPACAMPYKAAVAGAKIVFNAAVRVGLPKLRIVNFGGGFSSDENFAEAASTLSLALWVYFPDGAAVTVIAQPGHFFSESAFWLVVNIVATSSRGDNREYWINDGVSGSANRLLHDHAVIGTVLPIRRRGNGSSKYCSTVFGATCNPRDIVVKDCWLPEMEVGDWLVFPNMGACIGAAGSISNGYSASSIKTHLCCSS